MRPLFIVAALVVAGCTASDMPALESADTAAAPDIPRESCEGQAKDQCTFINSPVRLSRKAIRLPDGPYPFFRTRNTLKFVDARGQVWVAPAGILTDGASIPIIFVPLIGEPRSKEFLNAATVHDSYSAESNRDTPYYHAAPWQDVHRMFYDALRVSGTPPVKAKIMYAAVYLGGPRWEEVRTPPRQRADAAAPSAGSPLRARLQEGITVTATAARGGLRARQANVPLPSVYGKDQLLAAFRKAKAYIEANDPPIHQVEIYLTKLENEMGQTRAPVKSKRTNFGAAPDRGTENGNGGGLGGDMGDHGGDSGGSEP